MSKIYKVFLFLFPLLSLQSNVSLGIDTFLSKENIKKYKGKKIGLISNHTAINKSGTLTIDLLLKEKDLTITKIFAPEHGFYGYKNAGEHVDNAVYRKGLPILSLHGATRRPTKEMLKDVDVLIFDIQDIGIRSYTYTSTLFYCMEEAAKSQIDLIVLDRPNPMGGKMYDGPMMDKDFRSFIGYINVPYCHGMTAAELALFFNQEYDIKCSLTAYLMKNWDRNKPFKDTHLLWVPTSPHIPEADSPFYCATTGCIGELGVVSIGIGTSLPFKLVGAPWINAKKLTTVLNTQALPGVIFTPFYYTPSQGAMKNMLCHGIKIHITDSTIFKPCKTGNMILGILKSLYPDKITSAISRMRKNHLFDKAMGSDKYLSILMKEDFPAFKLIEAEEKDHASFGQTRDKYLLY
ncbi:MAG: hypothetical protein SP4CHLAM5_04190 [Chlamydiia bacterium]|nr:hypothetical protein [Chlamydiia bacterium]MCH9618292.1 hypothetical protein [Chlamydiia bacterium]MCH9624165.1 hypothetical protein [Chlamydiia bacterium]